MDQASIAVVNFQYHPKIKASMDDLNVAVPNHYGYCINSNESRAVNSFFQSDKICSRDTIESIENRAWRSLAVRWRGRNCGKALALRQFFTKDESWTSRLNHPLSNACARSGVGRKSIWLRRLGWG